HLCVARRTTHGRVWELTSADRSGLGTLARYSGGDDWRLYERPGYRRRHCAWPGCLLGDLKYQELGRFQPGEAHHDVDNAIVDVVLAGGSAVATHDVRLRRRAACECALEEQAMQERAHALAQRGPQCFRIRLGRRPLRAANDALLEEQCRASHGDILPLAGHGVGTRQGARAPKHRPRAWKRAKAIETQRIERTIFCVAELAIHALYALQHGCRAGRRLPYALVRIGAGVDTCHHATGRKVA